MELQFEVNTVHCLKQLKGEQQTREQTQELRLGDGMPDVGRVLCAWGQTVVRSKEWQPDTVSMHCGVMVWVMYSPEDGSQAQCVQAWLPMSFQWDIPHTQQDGTVNCHVLLRSVDARPLSGRKLMLRAVVCTSMQAYVPYSVEYYTPQNVPEDIHLKESVYPVCLAREAGEKAFMMDEEITLPDTVPGLEKPLRYSLQCEVEEKKILGDKLVFRGNTCLHLLYRTQEGALASYDAQLPFSQYTQLQQEYAGEPQLQMLPIVTSAELETDEQGRLRLKAGLSGQYLICENVPIKVVEDAYSPEREVTVQKMQVEIPGILERQNQRVRAEVSGNFGSSRVVDVTFTLGCPHKQRNPQEMATQLQGQFQALYYDTEGVLQASNANWQDTIAMGLDENANMDILCNPWGVPQAVAGQSATILRGELMLDTVTTATEPFDAASALSVGEKKEKDPQRPSLILRRAGNQSLWELAKENGSTTQAIMEANSLSGEPDSQQMLLIPVL